MPLQLLESQRLYQQAADQIRALIRAGEYGPGDRLPPERELARHLGVSRPTIREAMIALEIAGAIDIRAGAGIYVSDRGGRDAQGRLPALDPGPGPFDLLEARRILEGETARHAAERATPADLAAIREAIDAMEADMDRGGDGRPADRLFHARIAGATHNGVLATLVDGLWEGMSAPIFHGLSDRTGLPGHHRMTVADHRTIYEALCRHDPEEARAAMSAHLSHVEAVLADARDLAATSGPAASRPRKRRSAPRATGRQGGSGA